MGVTNLPAFDCEGELSDSLEKLTRFADPLDAAAAMTSEFERNKPDYSEMISWVACGSSTNQPFITYQLVFDNAYRNGLLSEPCRSMGQRMAIPPGQLQMREKLSSLDFSSATRTALSKIRDWLGKKGPVVIPIEYWQDFKCYSHGIYSTAKEGTSLPYSSR